MGIKYIYFWFLINLSLCNFVYLLQLPETYSAHFWTSHRPSTWTWSTMWLSDVMWCHRVTEVEVGLMRRSGASLSGSFTCTLTFTAHFNKSRKPHQLVPDTWTIITLSTLWRMFESLGSVNAPIEETNHCHCVKINPHFIWFKNEENALSCSWMITQLFLSRQCVGMKISWLY